MQKNEGVCCIQSNETSWTSRPHHLPHRFVGISLLSDKMTDNLQNPSSHNIIRLSRWFRWNYSFVSSASTFLWKFSISLHMVTCNGSRFSFYLFRHLLFHFIYLIQNLHELLVKDSLPIANAVCVSFAGESGEKSTLFHLTERRWRNQL